MIDYFGDILLEADTSKQQKNGCFFKKLLSENNFEAVLATFCCYDYGGNASETDQKIATVHKKAAQMLLGCYNLMNCQNIPTNVNSVKRLVTWTPPT